jgi:hypothetical protein
VITWIVVGALLWLGWLSWLSKGERRGPPLPSLGEYQRPITLLPGGAIQRKRSHDGRKG